MHVGDLDGSTVPGPTSWNATVTITVHDASENPVSGAVVTGSWSSGATGSGTCTTNASGQCSLIKNVRNTSLSVTFTVTNVTKSGFSYNAAANHDPDGDSTGTVIIIAKP
jgi:serine protease AprX